MGWMQNISKSQFILDTALALFFIITMVPQTTGVLWHEWLGLLIVAPFWVHLLIHWPWITRTPQKILSNIPLREKINVVWNLVLYVVMVLAILSGFLISEALLPLFGLHLVPDSYWFGIHHFFSELLMPLVGIHLALHWEWVLRIGKRTFKTNKQEAA